MYRNYRKSAGLRRPMNPEQIWRNVFDQQEKEPDKDLVKKRSPNEWHTVRIFVSSTFKDFFDEREVLVKETFQDLRLWCQDRRLRLMDVDLRWGIPVGTNSASTLKICLEEIDRCAKDNIMPYFLCLSSTRVGWVPSPYDKESDLMEAVLSKYKMIYGLSVTEMEIVRGAFRVNNPNALFLLRGDSFLKKLDDDIKYNGFIEADEVKRQEETLKVKELQKQINERFEMDQLIRYELRNFDADKKPRFEFHPDFNDKVLEFFKKRISLQYPVDDNLEDDEFQKARGAHESFLEHRAEGVQGRGGLVQEMLDHVKRSECQSPLLILGEPGTGKSAVMALAAKTAVQQITEKPEQDAHIFYHFVGAVPKSTELKDMLNRLLLELNVITDTLSDIHEAAQLVASALRNPSTPPLLLIVDAINQFDESTEAELVSWMPHKLVPQVRCILSMIPGTPHHQNLISREPQPEILMVEPLTREDCQIIAKKTLLEYNKRLSNDEMRYLLDNKLSTNPLWLSIACEELRVFGKFRKEVDGKKILLIQEKIKHFPESLEGLLGDVLSRFREDVGSETGQLLIATMCLLEVSKAGLLEDELLYLLADTDNLLPPEHNQHGEKGEIEKSDRERPKFEEHFPWMKWAIVRRSLKTFLRPFGDLNEGRLDFYHRSFSKVVRTSFLHQQRGDNAKNYLNQHYIWWHQKLADFFFTSTFHCRKAEELPYHLIRLKDKKRLKEFLSEWEALDELFDMDLSTTLFNYWRECADPDLNEMKECYKNKLLDMENDENVAKDVFSERLAQVSRLFTQAGELDESLEMAKKVLRLEESVLEQHEHHRDRLINIYNLLGLINSQRSRRASAVIDPVQVPHLEACIEHSRKATELLMEHPKLHEHRQLQLKLGRQKLDLAFTLYGLYRIRGDAAKNTEGVTADDECKQVNREAKDIFEKLGDMGSLAEATMNEAFSYSRKDERHMQPKLYEEAWRLCQQNFGKHCLLASRIQHNWALVYEMLGDDANTYEHFKQSFLIKYVIFGPKHVRTEGALDILRREDYEEYHHENVVMEEAKYQ